MSGFQEYSTYLLTLLGINIILASSLNIINGFCGLFSLGHAGFFAVGAYAASAATLYGFPELTASHPYLALLAASLIGMMASALVGLVVGIPCLRLTGDYLCIATVGFGEIIRIVILNMDSVGGARGLPGIAKLTNLWVVIGTTALTLWVLRNFINSSYGRSIIAVREDEIAARSMRVDVVFYKTFAFVVGSMLAGLAGALFAHNQQFIHPNNFNFMITVQVLLMIVIGGLGSQRGAVLGAILVTILPQLLRFNEFLAQFQMLIFGLVMVVIMLWRPEGLMSLLDVRSPKKGKEAPPVSA